MSSQAISWASYRDFISAPICTLLSQHKIVNTKKIAAVEQITVIAREARKYFGGIFLASQSIRDYVPEGSSTEEINKLKILFELCAYKFIMRQDSNVLGLLQTVFGSTLNSSDLEAIPKLKKGETILCLSSNRNIHLSVYITQKENELFSGGAWYDFKKKG